MSAEATFWAWRQSFRYGTAKLILLCLADCHNDKTGRCNPSLDYLVRKTGLNRKSIGPAIRWLEENGYVEVERRHGAGSNYTLKTSTDIGTSTNIGTSTDIGAAPVPILGSQPGPILGHEPKRNLQRTYKRKNDAIAFDEFWSAYPKKVGRAKAIKKWPKLSAKDQRAALDFLRSGPYADRERKYIPQGDTFLNARPWEDEDAAPPEKLGGVDWR